MCAKVLPTVANPPTPPRRPQFEHPDPLQQRIGQRLAYIMDHEEVSKMEVARHCGLSVGAIYHWITGRYKPTADNYKKLSRLLFVSVDYLMCMDLEHYSPDQLLMLDNKSVCRRPRAKERRQAVQQQAWYS